MSEPCTICAEQDGSEQHEHHGLVCSECYEDLENIEHDYKLSEYEKNIQEQIDAEPEIHIADGE